MPPNEGPTCDGSQRESEEVLSLRVIDTAATGKQQHQQGMVFQSESGLCMEMVFLQMLWQQEE